MFGLRGYRDALALPVALLPFAVDAEERLEVQRRLAYIQDASMAAGLKLGREYIDPKAKGKAPDPTAPYYSFSPLNDHREALLRRILPPPTEDQLRARREAEEDALFEAFAEAAAKH